MKSKERLKAILWLHLKRIGRYKYGFMNMILVDTMWYLIFLLGALTFVPREEYVETVVITFWGIVLWVMLNNWVWLIGNWTWFALSAGLVDEHIIRGVNPLAFIGGRFIVASLITLFTIPVVITIFSLLAGIAIYVVYNPFYLALGIIYMIIYATLYALILVAISLRTSVPGVMLDVTTIFLYIGGGLGVPVYKMPPVLRYVALALPYTHAAEIVRYGALGLEPYIGLYSEVLIGGVYALAMAVTTYIIASRVMRYVRRYGARSIGIM